MSYFSNLAIDEQNKIEKYFCEKCEEELPGECFTMDKEGEVCDSCCQAWGDLQYENWREREMPEFTPEEIEEAEGNNHYGIRN